MFQHHSYSGSSSPIARVNTFTTIISAENYRDSNQLICWNAPLRGRLAIRILTL
jgi:hypothetical protein